MPLLKDRLKLKRDREKVVDRNTFGMKGDIKQVVREEVGKFKKEVLLELKDMVKEAIGTEGALTIKGDKGDPGHNPVFGVDYLKPKEVEAIKSSLKGKDGADGEDGQPGIDSDSDLIVEEVLQKMPKSKDFAKDIEEVASKIKLVKPKDIVKDIESLRNTTNALDYFALKNKPTIPSEKAIKTIHRGGQGLAVFTTDLSASTDGSTKVFTVPIHTRVVLVTCTDQPNPYRPSVDYTTSGTTLTLTSEVNAPTAGATLLFIYAK